MAVDVISVDMARRAKALGYPQDETHHRWYWWPQGVFEHLAEPEVSCPGAFGQGVWHRGSNAGSERVEVEWCAAPSPVQVLEWLEKAKGWHWGRVSQRRLTDNMWVVWWTASDGAEDVGTAASIGGLLEQVFNRLEQEAK